MDYKIVEEQELLLQFERFSNDIAIDIGMMMIEQSRKEGQSIAVDISRCGQQISHAALEGTSPDIDEWLKKKRNTVYRFFCSTLSIQGKLKKFNATLESALNLSNNEYTQAGGGFPIIVKNVGLIGAIAASGTSEVQEHELITSCLSKYLNIDNCPSLLK